METTKPIGEYIDYPEFFPDTKVPTLSLERDGEWLSRLVVSPEKTIDEAYIRRLNEAVEQSLEPAPDKLPLRTMRHDGGMGVDMPLSFQTRASNSPARAARDIFSKEIGIYDPLSPLESFRKRTVNIRPVTFISSVRLLHAYVGEELASVVQRSPQLCWMTEISLRLRFDALAEAGIDCRKVLVQYPGLIRDGKTSRGLPFLEAARHAEERFDAKVRAAASLAGPTAMPDETPAGTAPEIPVLTETESARYEQLAEAGFMDVETIMQWVPEVRHIDDVTFQAVVHGVGQVAQSGRDVRFRDIIRLIRTDSR